MKQKTTTIYYSPEDLTQDILSLSESYKCEIGDTPPRSVIGINRGGVVPAAALAYSLNATDILSLHPYSISSYLHITSYITSHPHQTHIIMDDICDSGGTMTNVCRLLSDSLSSYMKHGGSVLFACLIHNTEQKFEPDLYGHQIQRSTQPEWYSFFWEQFALKREGAV
jgi:hypoxanthine phosphoribosyltransferase